MLGTSGCLVRRSAWLYNERWMEVVYSIFQIKFSSRLDKEHLRKRRAVRPSHLNASNRLISKGYCKDCQALLALYEITKPYEIVKLNEIESEKAQAPIPSFSKPFNTFPNNLLINYLRTMHHNCVLRPIIKCLWIPKSHHLCRGALTFRTGPTYGAS